MGVQADVKALNKQVQVSARADQRNCMDDAVQEGGWKEMRSLRTHPPLRQGRLRDKHGVVEDFEQETETMAYFLVYLQWKL
eukprot:4356814-Pyramimonas_sp.AAC.1